MALEVELSADWAVHSGSLDETIRVGPPDGTLMPRMHAPLILQKLQNGSSCEITVRFKQRYGQVSTIRVISTARTVEIYGQPWSSREGEYVCTVKGGPPTPPSLQKELSSGCLRASLESGRHEEVLPHNQVDGNVSRPRGQGSELVSSSEAEKNSKEQPDDGGQSLIQAELELGTGSEEAGAHKVTGTDTAGTKGVSPGMPAGVFEAGVKLARQRPWSQATIRFLSLGNKCRAEVYGVAVEVTAGPLQVAPQLPGAAPSLPLGLPAGGPGLGRGGGMDMMTMLMRGMMQMGRSGGKLPGALPAAFRPTTTNHWPALQGVAQGLADLPGLASSGNLAPGMLEQALAAGVLANGNSASGSAWPSLAGAEPPSRSGISGLPRGGQERLSTANASSHGPRLGVGTAMAGVSEGNEQPKDMPAGPNALDQSTLGLAEVCARLDRLEAICLRIESGLQLQMASLDSRIRRLEFRSPLVGSFQSEPEASSGSQSQVAMARSDSKLPVPEERLSSQMQPLSMEPDSKPAAFLSSSALQPESVVAEPDPQPTVPGPTAGSPAQPSISEPNSEPRQRDGEMLVAPPSQTSSPSQPPPQASPGLLSAPVSANQIAASPGLPPGIDLSKLPIPAGLLSKLAASFMARGSATQNMPPGTGPLDQACSSGRLTMPSRGGQLAAEAAAVGGAACTPLAGSVEVSSSAYSIGTTPEITSSDSQPSSSSRQGLSSISASLSCPVDGDIASTSGRRAEVSSLDPPPPPPSSSFPSSGLTPHSASLPTSLHADMATSLWQKLGGGSGLLSQADLGRAAQTQGLEALVRYRSRERFRRDASSGGDAREDSALASTEEEEAGAGSADSFGAAAVPTDATSQGPVKSSLHKRKSWETSGPDLPFDGTSIKEVWQHFGGRSGASVGVMRDEVEAEREAENPTVEGLPSAAGPAPLVDETCLALEENPAGTALDESERSEQSHEPIATVAAELDPGDEGDGMDQSKAGPRLPGGCSPSDVLHGDLTASSSDADSAPCMPAHSAQPVRAVLSLDDALASAFSAFSASIATVPSMGIEAHGGSIAEPDVEPPVDSVIEPEVEPPADSIGVEPDVEPPADSIRVETDLEPPANSIVTPEVEPPAVSVIEPQVELLADSVVENQGEPPADSVVEPEFEPGLASKPPLAN